MPHPSRVDDLQKSIARFAIIMTVGGLGFLATYFLTGGLASDDAKLVGMLHGCIFLCGLVMLLVRLLVYFQRR